MPDNTQPQTLVSYSPNEKSTLDIFDFESFFQRQQPSLAGAGFDPASLPFTHGPSLYLQNQPSQLKFTMPDFEKISGGVDTPVNAQAPALGRSLSIGQYLHNDPTGTNDEDLQVQPLLQKNESFGLLPNIVKKESNESPCISSSPQEIQKSKFALNPE